MLLCLLLIIGLFAVNVSSDFVLGPFLYMFDKGFIKASGENLVTTSQGSGSEAIIIEIIIQRDGLLSLHRCCLSDICHSKS